MFSSLSIFFSPLFRLASTSEPPAVTLGLTLMGIFWHLSDSTQEGIRSRTGILYLCASAEPYIQMIVMVQRFCTEMRVFDREQLDDLYAPSAYMVAQILASAPQLVLQPLLFGLPIYFGCGLRPGLAHVMMFLAVNVMLQFVINGLSMACVAINRSFSIASLIANSNFTFIGLTSGYLVNTHDLPVYVLWVPYLSFASYAYRIFMANEFSNRVFPGCSSPYLSDCEAYDGNAILDSQKIGVNDFAQPWPALVGICLCYHAVALVLLNVLKFPPSGSVGSEAPSPSVDSDSDDVGDEKTESIGWMVDVSSASKRRPSSIDDHWKKTSTSIEKLRSPVQNFGGSATSVTESVRKVSITVSNVTLRVRTSVSYLHTLRGTSVNPPPPVHSSALSSDTAPPPGAVYGDECSTRPPRSSSKTLLHSINAHIQPGFVTALMGGSGSGTLCHI